MWYGKGSAPPWVTALSFAERWHIPPWEIMERPGVLKWIARQSLIDDLRRQRAELDRKMAEQKAKG